MLASYLICAYIAHGPTAKPDPKAFYIPEILVQAKAIRAVQPKEGWLQVTFKIQHVYCGDANLREKTFQGRFSLIRSGLSTFPSEELEPPIKEGEVGIWRLAHADDDGRLIAITDNQGTHAEDGLCRWNLASPTPARKIIGDQRNYEGNHIHYPSALKWAQFVEMVYHTPLRERPKLLRQNVFSDNPYIAAYCIRTLSAPEPADLIQHVQKIAVMTPYLEKLADDPKLPIAAQVNVDDLLCEINPKMWMNSKRRMKLLEHWVSGDIIETRDVLMIAFHIQYALEYKHLDWDTWLPLMEKWVVQQYLAPPFEHRLYAAYESIVSREGRRQGRDRIVAYAVRLLKTSTDPKTQLFAAKWLVEVNGLTKEQLAAVKSLSDKNMSPEIRSLLNTAIERSTPRRPG